MSAATERLSDSLRQYQERYMALSSRERWILAVGAAAVLLTLVYLLLWEPMVKAHEHRAQSLANARAVAQQLEAIAPLAQRARGTQGVAQTGRNLSLIAAIDQSIKQASPGKAPSRMQPEGEDEVRVWFEDVPFDTLTTWLGMLQKTYGIRVQTLDVERKSTVGVVDARLSLVRGR